MKYNYNVIYILGNKAENPWYGITSCWKWFKECFQSKTVCGWFARSEPIPIDRFLNIHSHMNLFITKHTEGGFGHCTRWKKSDDWLLIFVQNAKNSPRQIEKCLKVATKHLQEKVLQNLLYHSTYELELQCVLL